MASSKFNPNVHLLFGPESAMVVGDAKGKDGHRSGIYGHSDQSTGVIADSTSGIGLVASGPTAGYFNGAVEISGTLTVEGVPIIERLNQILNVLADMKNVLADMKQRTYHGVPMNPPKRPVLDVRQVSTAKGHDDVGPGFVISGSGFFPYFDDFTDTGDNVPAPKGVTIWVFITHLVTGVRGVLQEQRTFVYMPDASGAFSQQRLVQTMKVGDKMTFAATDGSADGFDATGKLWSNNVELVVW